MNDALKDPSCDLAVKLHWLPDQNISAEGQCVVVELLSANGLALTNVSVPSKQLLQAVAQKLRHYSVISPSGFVSVVSDEITEALAEGDAIPFDQLVAEAISPDMLEDEPNARQMLSELRARLHKSLELVEQTIESLTKD